MNKLFLYEVSVVYVYKARRGRPSAVDCARWEVKAESPEQAGQIIRDREMVASPSIKSVTLGGIVNLDVLNA